MMEQEVLTIGQVSQRTELSSDTIRPYTKIGFLPGIHCRVFTDTYKLEAVNQAYQVMVDRQAIKAMLVID